MSTRLESDDPKDWTITVDGVADVPFVVAVALAGPPLEPWRIWRHGHIEACGLFDYGPGYGPLLTIVFEGGAVVWRPDEEPKKRIQKVNWRQVKQVAEALGLS